MVVSLFAFLFAGCASAVTKPIPGGETVVVDAPTYKPGDEWHLADLTTRVVAIEDGFTVTEFVGESVRCRGCRYYRDRHLIVVRVLEPGGQEAPAHDVLPARRLDFPLRVGKKWVQEGTFPQVTGGQSEYEFSFEVEAYEEVTVPAGTFKAFRIGWRQVNRTIGGQAVPVGSAKHWWSPDVRWFIRIENFSGRTGELKSFSLK